MSYLRVTDVALALPDGRPLFSRVNFLVSPGQCAALVGVNGAGKSTLMRVVAGRYPDAYDGSVILGGEALYMPQHVGQDPWMSVRQMLLMVAPAEPRRIGLELADATQKAIEGDVDAGLHLGELYESWQAVGGYEWEARWDQAARSVTGRGFGELADLPSSELSGGERKRIALRTLLESPADILLLDEPDNFLDIPAKEWLERELTQTSKCVLLISHDRELLQYVPVKIITLEGRSAWVHAGSFSSYEEAREARQADLDAALRRWHDEERRLHAHYRTMKQRAAVNDKNAPKADAAETRWKKFVESGRPAPPVKTEKIRTRLAGASSGELMLSCSALAIPGLVKAFALDVFRSDRVGVIGPNGTGKSHLLRAFAGVDPTPAVRLGARVRAGHFTQGGEPDLDADEPLAVSLRDATRNEEDARAALGRYGLAKAYRQRFASLSGGEKARIEILLLELRGVNLLLLDEPTDNLDVESAESLETALESFEGAVVSVSHDRTFLRQCNRFFLLTDAGMLFEVDGFNNAIDLLRSATASPRPEQARLLSTTS